MKRVTIPLIAGGDEVVVQFAVERSLGPAGHNGGHSGDHVRKHVELSVVLYSKGLWWTWGWVVILWMLWRGAEEDGEGAASEEGEKGSRVGRRMRSRAEGLGVGGLVSCRNRDRGGEEGCDRGLGDGVALEDWARRMSSAWVFRMYGHLY